VRSALGRVAFTLARVYLRHAPFEFGKRRLFLALRPLAPLKGRTNGRTVFGATMQLDTHDLAGQYIYCFGVWEPNLTNFLRRMLEPGDVFVDVGAHIGYFSLLPSTLVGPDGGVFSRSQERAL
jgi:hypothetical protein